MTVAAMLRQIKVPEMDVEVERIGQELRKATLEMGGRK
jgi:hypothetical protein